MNAAAPFAPGARIALLTQHGKERVIAPAFAAAFGVAVERVRGIDTDTFGTFTRETPRAGSQLEAARAKARAGMRAAGLPYGIASEGAFCPDPTTGFLPWNVETVVLLDDTRGIEIAGWADGPGLHVQGTATTRDAARKLAHAAGFPDHHLVLRPNRLTDPRVRKGVDSWAALDDAFAWARAVSDDGSVALESDLRAHAHPSRMQMIALATRNLVARLQSRCPQCDTPGFWSAERIPGLPCGDCGAPTRAAYAERLACVRCSHSVVRELTDTRAADPARCELCNP